MAITCGNAMKEGNSPEAITQTINWNAINVGVLPVINLTHFRWAADEKKSDVFVVLGLKPEILHFRPNLLIIFIESFM